MRIRSIIIAAVAGSVFNLPATGQSNDDFWKNTWFWGAQAGTFLYSGGGTTNVGVTFGGHWFITSNRAALSISFDQMLLPTTNITVGQDPASFSSAQRLTAMLYALPSKGTVQLFLGGGFAINNLTDATTTGTFGSLQAQNAAQQRVASLGTKAFAVLGGGAQWRVMDKWVVFGQYHYMPGTSDFLITSGQHAIQGGLRYALTAAKENVSTER